MSRTLSAEMQAVATAEVVRPIYLIDMAFSASTVRLWSGLGDLTAPIGSNLVTNGTFDSGITGWAVFEVGSGDVTWVNGEVRETGANFSNRAGVRQTIGTVAGKTYQVRLVSDGTVTLLKRDMVGNANIGPAVNYSAGLVTHTFTAVSASTRIEIRNQSGGTIAIDNVEMYVAEDYVGAGDLLKISEIQETSDLQANGASVTLSGVNTALVGLARDQDYQGKRMSVSLGAMDDVANVIVSPVNLFTGFMDVMTINDGGTYSDISVTCENKLIAFEKAYIRRYTDNDQKIEHPTDNGFEYVASIQEKEIVWGKPTPNTASTRPPVDTRGTR